jgi:nucleotide-binding universal stress UspA family protein
MRKLMKRILCATDFSDHSSYALPYAVSLAQVFESKLQICHVIDLPPAGIYGEAVLYTEEQEERIKRYARKEIGGLIGEQTVPWESLIVHGRAAEEIARIAQEVRADLVIAGTHGRSTLSRLLLGSVTERLMRTLPCPLLVVKGPKEGKMPRAGREIRFERILVGCDFSPYSSLALEYGLSLAQEFESELHLVHVIAPPVYKDLAMGRKWEAGEQQALRESLTRKIESLIPEETRHWCTPTISLLAGEPHEELTKYAVVQDVDLVVLGIHGRGLVEELFVGSTTDRVVREVPCPVLSVRPTHPARTSGDTA